MKVNQPPYRGRFAPTPSGPLHLGSLLTALASYLQARRHGGAWLLRIDDLDRARCPAGMETQILRQLEAHGLLWDEAPRRQSDCAAAYREALEALSRAARLYACTCTRARLRAASRPGPDGAVYDGHCRAAGPVRGSLRARVADERLCFEDGWQGLQCRALAQEVGDFVVRRADGLPAYQLACAVDEAAQGITEVVRGADLLGSTFQQRWLLQALRHEAPAYRHLPVLIDARGRKLSKQNHAAPVLAHEASRNLARCLRLLGQAAPVALEQAAPAELLQFAIAHWDAACVPKGAQLPGSVLYNALQQSSATPP